jgi:phosphoenolpyruvate carboxykinase (GTP)
VPWPCDAENKYIVHFPETHEIISYGSGYGGNALLGKKCFALRIASVLARDNGWLAEHMLILKLTSPAGESRYVDRRLPERLRQDEPRDARADASGLEGRDHRRRHLLDEARPRRSPLRHQPRGRLLRRRAGHQHGDQPQRDVHGRSEHHLHQYRPHRRRRHLVGGHGRSARRSHRLEGPALVQGARARPAAHPNSRFTAPADQDPAIAPEWEDPAGVPIDAILFGGRRASVVPLVFQSRSWDHGVFLGSIMASETTAAATGAVGKLRRDPFAMLPFCGYNMADYFAHWLTFSERFDEEKLPKIFYVNWFRKGDDGRWLWPGYGENSRVLEWIFERVRRSRRGR